ncbi:ATP-binding protein [Nocardioides perillae]|uniref:ATP-binding protein n=1 Tax=Nocardioides perillae TaxID=1119534 RepID=UPI0031B5A45B
MPASAPLHRQGPATVDTATQARHDFVAWLTELGVADADLVAGEHAVGELLANVVEHAYDTRETAARADRPNALELAAHLGERGQVTCTVVDRGAWVEPAPVATRTSGGRGLALIHAFTDSFAVEPGADGGTRAEVVLALGRLVGTRLPGLQATAAASGCAALLTAPALVAVLVVERPGPWVLLAAVASGVLSSVVPYALDLTALGSVPPRAFGVLSSVHPVLAVVVGVVLLHQVPAGHELVGTAVVVLANVVAVATMRGR